MEPCNLKGYSLATKISEFKKEPVKIQKVHKSHVQKPPSAQLS